MRIARLSRLLVVTALLAVACSGGSGETTSPSPVGSFVADYSSASGYDEVVARAADDCMAAAGFRYDYEAIRSAGTGTETRAGDGAGFGISTGYTSPGEYLTDPLRFVSPAEVDYFGTLDPLQQARYLRRLYIGATGLDGCLSLAFEAGFGLRPPALDRLQQRALTLRSETGAAESEPGVTGGWSECMAGKGFNYTAPDDLVVDLRRRLDGIAGRFGESPVAALIQQDPNFRADPIPAQAFDEGYPPLLALQEYETGAARASADCGVDPGGIRLGTSGPFPRAGVAGGRGPLLVVPRQREAELTLLRDMEPELRPLAESVGLDFDSYLG